MRRRLWLIGGLALALVIILLVSSALPFLNRLTHPASIDLAVSGGLTGRMTTVSRYRDFDWGCMTSTVQGQREWSGNFVAVLGNDHLLFAVAIFPYVGPGQYDDPDLLDNQGRMRPGINWPVIVLLSTIPPTDPTATEYGTYPNPAFAHMSQPPIGHASLTLKPDQKSGQITVVLMNARAIAETPVTVTGTFKCGTVDSR